MVFKMIKERCQLDLPTELSAFSSNTRCHNKWNCIKSILFFRNSKHTLSHPHPFLLLYIILKQISYNFNYKYFSLYHEAKRRRTERVRREKINSTVNKDLENRKRSRSNSHSDHIRRGRGRPKSASAKKHEEEREKQEKEIDIYANLSDEKAFVFSVALAEINRKIINQRLIL
ncbi:hypothetical protein FD755_006921 [Muntiacus reevesi]|uniref:Uncharacterized protein n=1 Tax=Muntiacus reevesi TaxID=9886 RepID=A0A5J5MXJ8_MUNRE|nr:hypothetical protein FD755_006921 [Muntiacus reevesi]